MKNSSIFWTTLIMVPLLFALCVGAVRSAENRKERGANVMYGTAELRNEIRIPASEAEVLEIAYTSKNINIYPATTDEIIIKEYLLSDSENAKATVSRKETEGGKRLVTVSGAKTQITTIFHFGVGERIEVYLPKAAVESLTIKTNSGNICSEEANFDLQVNDIHVQASSGNITWVNTVAKEMNLETSSGNINAREISGNLIAKASSGVITIEEFIGEASVEANSGNVRVAVKELNGELKMKTGSGNIEAVLPENAEFTLEAQAGSGRIRTNFDEQVIYNEKHNHATATIGNSPALSVKATAGSGNINIKS